jgi:hypothetical protein
VDKWIEVTDSNSELVLINLDSLDRVVFSAHSYSVSFVYSDGRYTKVPFDSRYGSLVDFINSKIVKLGNYTQKE